MQTKFDSKTPMGSVSTKSIHEELQRLRSDKKDVSLEGFLKATWGEDATVQQFYKELGIDMTGQTVKSMLETTSDQNRFLFPEIIRDAIIRGLEYTPFYSGLVAANEQIDGNGLTMPFMDWTTIDRDTLHLRDTNEGATITEGSIMTWSQKQVTVGKKSRGLKQTYESIMWTPIDLAAIFFEEVGTQLGADLDRELVDIALNGDQENGSESAPVIGVENANTLVFTDLVRAWVRFKRIGRNSSVMLTGEADAITILSMPEFQKTLPGNGASPSGITLNVSTPLPTSQDIFVHDAIPAKKLILVDRARAFIQLTAMPLLVETEKIVSRQITGQYVSIITGFANIFKDGRLVVDYSTNLTTNPGPTPPSI